MKKPFNILYLLSIIFILAAFASRSFTEESVSPRRPADKDKPVSIKDRPNPEKKNIFIPKMEEKEVQRLREAAEQGDANAQYELGISTYLKKSETSEEEMDRVLTKLKEYGKNLWIDSCVDAAGEDESESDVREETDYIFDYVFENHEHPY